MKNYIEDIKSFIKNRAYMFCVIMIAIISFGYAAFNTSIGIDDLEYDRYVGSGNVMLAAGRFGIWFWSLIQGFWENSYVIDIVAIFFLIFSAINFSILFKRVSGNKISNPALTVFSCMLISYPLVLEIWEYTGANVNICGAYLLVSFSLLLIYEHICKYRVKKIWRMIPACIMMTIVCAGYESVVSVYVFFVFAVLSLQIIYGGIKEKKFFSVCCQGLVYAIVLAVGVALRVIVHKIILLTLDLEPIVNGATNIVWGTKPVREIIRTLISDWIIYYLFRGIVYLPLTIFAISMVIFAIMGIILWKRHGIVMLIPGLGMLLSLVLISIVQGSVSPYRTCQVFSVFVAFTAMILIQLLSEIKIKKNWIKITALVSCGVLCFYQATYINYFLEMNHRRSEREAYTVREISVDLQRSFDKEKPVIFVGTYTLDDSLLEEVSISRESLRWQIYQKLALKSYEIVGRPYYADWLPTKLAETNVNSVINWAINAFGQEAMINLFSYYGYEYVPADYSEVYEKALAYAQDNNMPTYPKNGYIEDVGDYIIVNLK